MIWQDTVIAIANLLFTYSISHQVYYGFKKKKGLITLTTSSLTIIGLIGAIIAFASLKLYMSTVIVSITSILWTCLFIQRIIYKKS